MPVNIIDRTQTHELHRNPEGFWAYHGGDGQWRQFMHDSHFEHTARDKRWTVCYFTLASVSATHREILRIGGYPS